MSFKLKSTLAKLIAPKLLTLWACDAPGHDQSIFGVVFPLSKSGRAFVCARDNRVK